MCPVLATTGLPEGETVSVSWSQELKYVLEATRGPGLVRFDRGRGLRSILRVWTQAPCGV